MKFKKDKLYKVNWLDHATCYPGWTDSSNVNDQELECFSVGILVKETPISIYLAISKYDSDSKYCGMMQIIKSTILKIKELK